MNDLDKLWDNGSHIVAWTEATTPDDDLIYKEGHPSQSQSLLAVECLLDLTCRIVGDHLSKSVRLPVAMFKANIYNEETVYFFTRDNFHDLKLVVVSACSISMSYDVIHRQMTPEELETEKQRSYTYRKTHKDFNPEDYETDVWFDGWCSDSLLRPPDGNIYRCSTVHPVYYEGMKQVGVPTSAFQRYERGRSEFAAEIKGDYVELQVVMKAVINAARKIVMMRRELRRAAKA